ncbi:MAG: M1 family metallopeptidase [Flavobacteriales bacterium]|nr:M1 family metallopeptidase [Flavobacteriales bacterium]
MKIAAMKLARDPHTWSRPNEARVTHLNWEAKVDFAQHSLKAKATYDIENLGDTSYIVFDTKGLAIEKVEVDGNPVGFELGPEKEFLGQPLAVPIKSDSRQVAISYSTGAEAEALQWVDGDSPFLYTQSQAILARTWIPCQDSPGVRITYNATVECPPALMALMSAENPQQKSADGIYHFKMDQPVPSYLMALAVGNLEFREIGKQTGVYALPEVIESAANEFSDMQKMVEAAEALYGPYVWGRYDLLILPGSFPFGGMENPRLTFATPTIIAGDKSLVSLVAHELAHSWSGNLVTNSTWDDFWLNEGFTVYFEHRIMEAVYGRELSEMLARLARQDLDATIADLGASAPDDTKLKLSLEGRNPDDGMTDIAYNKGYFFLRLIEETVGREKFDAFLRGYFDKHKFQVMDTEKFVTYLRSELVNAEIDKTVQIDAWVYGPGLPSNIPAVNSAALTEADSLREGWENGKIAVTAIPWNNWTYQQQYRFISNLSDKTDLKRMAELDGAFQLTKAVNNEVVFAWLQQSIRRNYSPAYQRVEQFLGSVGRRKFVAPLFTEMVDSGQLEWAKKVYSTTRDGYHAVTINTVDGILGLNKEAAAH